MIPYSLFMHSRGPVFAHQKSKASRHLGPGTKDQERRTKNEGLKDYACAGCAIGAQNLSNASVRLRAIVSAVWFSI